MQPGQHHPPVVHGLESVLDPAAHRHGPARIVRLGLAGAQRRVAADQLTVERGAVEQLRDQEQVVVDLQEVDDAGHGRDAGQPAQDGVLAA